VIQNPDDDYNDNDDNDDDDDAIDYSDDDTNGFAFQTNFLSPNESQ